MLQKIANSLVHGNFRTKLFLWSVIALGTAALILLAAALALGMPALGAGAAEDILLNPQQERKEETGQKTT